MTVISVLQLATVNRGNFDLWGNFDRFQKIYLPGPHFACGDVNDAKPNFMRIIVYKLHKMQLNGVGKSARTNIFK